MLKSAAVLERGFCLRLQVSSLLGSPSGQTETKNLKFRG